jgi:hypothetical protein
MGVNILFISASTSSAFFVVGIEIIERSETPIQVVSATPD